MFEFGMPVKRLLVRVRRTPSAGLLFVQLSGLVLYPFMEHTATGRALFGAFGLLVLALAVWVVRRSPWVTWLGGALALAVLALSLANALAPHRGLVVITSLLEAAFYFYTAGSLIAYMMQDQSATLDELFAAGATFTLLAWAFAYVYLACQAVQPGSFGAAVNPEAARSWLELLFLSFTTLSGVGLGDVIPLRPLARGLVMLEQFTGVMYLALVVSRLVALSAVGRR